MEVLVIDRLTIKPRAIQFRGPAAALVNSAGTRHITRMEPQPADIDRTRQIMDTTEALLVERKTVAIPLNDIAQRVGVSRSLLYVYFEGVPEILDALFREHAHRLEHAVLPNLSHPEPYRARLTGIATAYLAYLIEAGPILNLLLRERHQDSPLSTESKVLFRRLMRALATDMRSSLDLSSREAFVLLELVSAIPEALARLVRNTQIDRETAEQTCARLVGVATDAFPPKTTNG